MSETEKADMDNLVRMIEGMCNQGQYEGAKQLIEIEIAKAESRGFKQAKEAVFNVIGEPNTYEKDTVNDQ